MHVQSTLRTTCYATLCRSRSTTFPNDHPPTLKVIAACGASPCVCVGGWEGTSDQQYLPGGLHFVSVQGMEVAPLLALPLGDRLQHRAVLGPARATQYPWIPLQPKPTNGMWSYTSVQTPTRQSNWAHHNDFFTQTCLKFRKLKTEESVLSSELTLSELTKANSQGSSS